MTIDRLVREADLCTRKNSPGIIPVCRATLRRWVKDGQFPAPIKIGPYSVAWRMSEVQAWIDSRERTSNAGGAV